jgi:dienelactone hydrolase
MMRGLRRAAADRTRWATLVVLGLGLSGCASARAPVRAGTTTAAPAPLRDVPPTAPAPALSPPPELAPESIALEFDSGPRRLSGTLSLPARHAAEQVPAVLIVHGSGPLSRDGVMRGQLGLGFGFELPVYARLAAALAAHGYAVYRYDKRTCGTFNDCADNRYPTVPPAQWGTEFTTEAYRQDALGAIAALESHDAIDPGRVFVVGHSQGASLVPLLLADRPELRAGVMLAPPFHSIGTLVTQQSATVYWAFQAVGQPERADRERQLLAAAARAIERVEAGTHLGEPILGESPDTWASWIQLSRAAPRVARNLDRPLLVLGGDYDYNVSASEITAWQSYLRQARAAHRVRILPCVTHALNCIAQPDPRRIRPEDIGHEIAPAVISELVAFLASPPTGP